MTSDCSCGTYCEHGFMVSPMEYVKANGFIDFPHAWMIARRTAPEYHHNECSFNTTGGAILCDCEVLTESPEYVWAALVRVREAIDREHSRGCSHLHQQGVSEECCSCAAARIEDALDGRRA